MCHVKAASAFPLRSVEEAFFSENDVVSSRQAVPLTNCSRFCCSTLDHSCTDIPRMHSGISLRAQRSVPLHSGDAFVLIIIVDDTVIVDGRARLSCRFGVRPCDQGEVECAEEEEQQEISKDGCHPR